MSVTQSFRCDRCGTYSTGYKLHENRPDGWINVYGWPEQSALHFCSPACLSEFTQPRWSRDQVMLEGE